MRKTHTVPCAEEMAGEKEIASCVTTYTRIYGQQQLGKCWCVARSQPTTEKIFVVKFIHINFLDVFCVRKYFYNENEVNYGMSLCHDIK